MTAVSAGPGKSASQIFFYDWSDNYRRVIKVEHPGDYHESQGTRRAREQVALAMLYVKKVNNRRSNIHKIEENTSSKNLQINQSVSVDMQYYKGIRIE